MKKHPLTIFVACLLALTAVACGGRNSNTTAETDVQISVEPMSTAVGETMLMISLADADGDPINDAAIDVKGDMTHAGMQPVLAEASGGENGQYSVPFEWTMAGDWIVTVDVTLADGTTLSQTFDDISIDGDMADMDMEEMDGMEHGDGEMDDMEMEEEEGG